MAIDMETTKPMTLDVYPQILTVREVAEILRVTPRTVWRYQHEFGLPFWKFGGTVRTDKNELIEWLKTKRKGQGSASNAD